MRVLGGIFAVLFWFGLHDAVRADVECGADGELINETVTISIDLSAKTCVLVASLSDANSLISGAESFVTVSLIAGTERLAVILMESKVQDVFVDPFILSHDVTHYDGRTDVDTFYLALADQVPSAARGDGRGSSIGIEVGAGDRRFMLHILGLRREQGADKASYARIAVAGGPFGALERPGPPPDDAGPISESDDASATDVPSADSDAASERSGAAKQQAEDTASQVRDMTRDATGGQTLWPDLIIGIDELKPGPLARVASRRSDAGTPGEGNDDGNGDGNDGGEFIGAPDRLSRTLTLGDMLKPSPSVIDPKSTLNAATLVKDHARTIWNDWRPNGAADAPSLSLFFGQPDVGIPAVIPDAWLSTSAPGMFGAVQAAARAGIPLRQDGLWRAWNDALPSLDDPVSLLGPTAGQDAAEPGMQDRDEEGEARLAPAVPIGSGLFDEIVEGNRRDGD